MAIRKADELVARLVASGRIIVGSESGSPNACVVVLTTSHARGRRVKDNRKCERGCVHVLTGLDLKLLQW